MVRVRSKLLVALAIMASQALTGQAQSGAGAPIKLSDPNPSLPTEMITGQVNNRDEVVGHIGDNRDGIGFLRTGNGHYQEFAYPGQCHFEYEPGHCTYAVGVNDRGQIVGYAYLQSGYQPFLREANGRFRALPPAPGNLLPSPSGINNRGDIVGTYNGGDGFLLHNGRYQTIRLPGANGTVCTGINNSGLVTGYYFEDGIAHGFLWWRGNFIATFQGFVNGTATGIFPVAVNDRGEVVGGLGTPAPGSPSGSFLRDTKGNIKGFDMTTLLKSISPFGGIVTGINNRGELVGFFGLSPREIYGFLVPVANGEREVEDGQ